MNGGGYNRYLLISGADLPLRTNGEIARFFAGNGAEYFSWERLPKHDWKNGGFDRLDFWHLNTGRTKGLTLDRLLNAANERIAIPLLAFLGIRRRRFCASYFGGANWMNLTDGCVAQVLDFVRRNEGYLRSFRFTRCADEIFFQTIIMNYVSGVTVVNDDLRYIDWRRGPEFPRTLRMDDYERMRGSGALFARKFDFRTDAAIIDRLYDDIGGAY